VDLRIAAGSGCGYRVGELGSLEQAGL
jgi:hypothetical protein